MNCPLCTAVNPEGLQFCADCGADLKARPPGLGPHDEALEPDDGRFSDFDEAEPTAPLPVPPPAPAPPPLVAPAPPYAPLSEPTVPLPRARPVFEPPPRFAPPAEPEPPLELESPLEPELEPDAAPELAPVRCGTCGRVYMAGTAVCWRDGTPLAVPPSLAKAPPLSPATKQGFPSSSAKRSFAWPKSQRRSAAPAARPRFPKGAVVSLVAGLLVVGGLGFAAYRLAGLAPGKAPAPVKVPKAQDLPLSKALPGVERLERKPAERSAPPPAPAPAPKPAARAAAPPAPPLPPPPVVAAPERQLSLKERVDLDLAKAGLAHVTASVVNECVVTLRGTVRSEAEKRKAEELAMARSGVQGMVSMIVLADAVR